MFYAYLLRCRDGTLYGGWTTDLERRLRAHNSGRGAKYTRARLPVELVYWEELPSRQAAMSREWQLKHLTRAEKLALVRRQAPRSGPGVVMRAEPRLWMSGGRIVYDVSGEEKQKLTIDALIKKFSESTGQAFASDKALLG